MTSTEDLAKEGIEWCESWRDGMFEPAYYDRKWPVEMYGLVEDHERLAKAYLELSAAQTA